MGLLFPSYEYEHEGPSEAEPLATLPFEGQAVTLRAAIEAQLLGTPSDLAALFTTDVVCTTPHATLRSLHAVEAACPSMDDTLSDVRLTFRSFQQGGTSACAEWRLDGVFSGPVLLRDDVLVEPTGEAVHLVGATFADFRDALISVIRHYFDDSELLAHVNAAARVRGWAEPAQARPVGRDAIGYGPTPASSAAGGDGHRARPGSPTIRLLLLRHGPAGSRSTWTGDDRDRPLTDPGARCVRRVAHRLAQEGVAPDVILTSPLARCATTAAIVRDVLGLPDAPQADPVLAPGFGVAQLQALLASHEDATELMLVGHEPDLSRIVEHLTGAHLVMKKGALVELELSREVPQSAVLVRLEQPEHLVP